MKKESKCNARLVSCASVGGGPGTLAALVLGAALLLLLIGRVQLTLAQETRQPQGTAKTGAEAKRIARGKYIVEGLAACGDCHTPRDRDGNTDRTKWLTGAPVFYEPARNVPGWAHYRSVAGRPDSSAPDAAVSYDARGCRGCRGLP